MNPQPRLMTLDYLAAVAKDWAVNSSQQPRTVTSRSCPTGLT
jgi:hypothetical protein